MLVLMRGWRKWRLAGGGGRALDLRLMVVCFVDLGHSRAGEVPLAHDELFQTRRRVRAGVRRFQPAIVRERIDVDEGYRRGQSVCQLFSGA